ERSVLRGRKSLGSSELHGPTSERGPSLFEKAHSDTSGRFFLETEYEGRALWCSGQSRTLRQTYSGSLRWNEPGAGVGLDDESALDSDCLLLALLCRSVSREHGTRQRHQFLYRVANV